MLTSTLPRFAGDMQANFVGEQAKAWSDARADALIHILAPHDQGAPLHEVHGRITIERFRYMLPESWQRLAYPAILPNIRRSPVVAMLLPGFLLAQLKAAARVARRKRVDLVYAHWIMPQGLVAWRLKRKLGIPYVLQNHSSD
ncbi:MAG: glycosyltransferase, partial [Erythrobacter sp.]